MIKLEPVGLKVHQETRCENLAPKPQVLKPMGSGASAAKYLALTDVVLAEAAKPADASDIDGSDAIAAVSEVRRLREVLHSNAADMATLSLQGVVSPPPRTAMLCSNSCGHQVAVGYPTCCRSCTASGGTTHGPICQALAAGCEANPAAAGRCTLCSRSTEGGFAHRCRKCRDSRGFHHGRQSETRTADERAAAPAPAAAPVAAPAPAPAVDAAAAALNARCKSTGCRRLAVDGYATCCRQCAMSNGDRHDKECEITTEEVLEIVQRRTAEITAVEDPANIEAEYDKFTTVEAIWDALGDEPAPVVLISAKWLMSWSKSGRKLPRRQELPADAFLSLAAMQRISKDRKERYGVESKVLPIVVISYCWLTAKHPDPDGAQLKIIVSLLEEQFSAGQIDTYKGAYNGKPYKFWGTSVDSSMGV